MLLKNVEGLQNQKAELEKGNAALNEKATQLETQKNEWKRTADVIEKKRTEQQQQNIELQQVINRLKEKENIKPSPLRDPRERNVVVEARDDPWRQNRIAELENETVALKNQITYLEQCNQKLQAEINRLKIIPTPVPSPEPYYQLQSPAEYRGNAGDI
jgi:chromosome segregation ATPase